MRTLSHGLFQRQQSLDMTLIEIIREIEARNIHTGVQHAHHLVNMAASRTYRSKDLGLSRTRIIRVKQLFEFSSLPLDAITIFFLVLSEELGAFFLARFHVCQLLLDVHG